MIRPTDSTICQRAPLRSRLTALAPLVASALLLGACANGPKLGESLALADAKATTDESKVPQNELEKALEYWGKQHAKAPREVGPAINYARNLKAANEKEKALAVLQTTAQHNSGNRDLASEYGRLALEVGQTSLAMRLLEMADDPAKPDWKIISARGTAFAKQGEYGKAIPLYERALLLAPGQLSVQSNLAMAHAASGEAPRAEAMLRKIANEPGADVKVRQNLALVLSLQGKYDEARAVAAKDMPVDSASANVEYVRQMVRVSPQAAPDSAAAIGPGVWVTNVATGSVSRPAAQPAGMHLKPSQR